MKWLFLSLGCAFFTATTAVFTKLILRRHSVFYAGWVGFVFAIPIFVVFVYIHRTGLRFTPDIWKIVVILLPLEFVAFLMYLKALKVSPLSLTFPFLGLTPAFTLLSSYVFLREKSSLQGIVGVGLVSMGAYLLNANALKKGILEPIRHIYREKGSILMVLVAFIYSITSVLGKKAVLLSNPLSFATVYYAIFLVILTPLVLTAGKTSKPSFGRRDVLLAAGLGTAFAIAMLLHFNAIILTHVSYVISVKRLSLIVSIFYGALIFRERDIGYRLLGSFVMLCGVVVISFVK